MYRIRFHGRGGQGMKTAGRILGTAFFLEGYHVQDAPRYGAERRGAPIFAFVRVSDTPINERGIIHIPDLVVVADGTLLDMPAAQVMAGCSNRCIVLAETDENSGFWQEALDFKGTIVTVPRNSISNSSTSMSELSSFWAGTAARLCNTISVETLETAVCMELESKGTSAVDTGVRLAKAGWDMMEPHQGIVQPSGIWPEGTGKPPDWVVPLPESVELSAPAVRASSTSIRVKTGLWRTSRPVINYTDCKQCWWNCTVYCPDSVISVNNDGHPVIDYDHCKGCLICAAECKGGAIQVVSERDATNDDKGGC